MGKVRFLIQSERGHDEELIDLSNAGDKVKEELANGKWAHVETNSGETKTFTELPKEEETSDQNDTSDKPKEEEKEENKTAEDWKNTFGVNANAQDKPRSVTVTGKSKGA